MSNPGGRSSRSSASQALGANDPRLRRNAQSGATDNDLGNGIELDPKGRIALSLDVQGALYIRPDGTVGLRVGDGLALAAGSPVAVRVTPADKSILVDKDGLRARPSASQVLTVDGITVEADLAAKQDLAEKNQTSGYLGIGSTGFVDASKLGTGYAGSGAKYLADNGSYKAITGGASISRTSVAFTDGDCAKRVSVADAAITATDKILVTVRRPDMADDSADSGHIYLTNIVRIYAGGFDVRIVALDLSGEDTTAQPPNETIELQYQVAA